MIPERERHPSWKAKQMRKRMAKQLVGTVEMREEAGWAARSNLPPWFPARPQAQRPAQESVAMTVIRNGEE